MARRLIALVLILLAAHAFGATQGGSMPVPLPLFPANNWWNVDISSAPTVADSSVYYPFMGGTARALHPDFGGNDLENEGYIYGIPFIVVDGAQPKVTVDFVETPEESDGVGQAFYPVPTEAITQMGWVEGGPPGNVDVGGDRHMLIVDQTNNDLYELYAVFYNGANWEAGSGAFFDMDTNDRRTEGWTSADASGMAILPGLVRYDEVYGPGEILHAFRVTVGSTNGHVFPASHTAGSTAGALPMGARLRLKAGVNISTYPAEMQKIFRAFKKYGLIVADNGSNMYVSGTYDIRWDNDVLNPAFGGLKASDFEVIQLGWKPSVSLVLDIPSSVGAGDAVNATLTAYDSDFNVATGYTGTVHFSSTDGSATLPGNYTFTPGDNGMHAFPAQFIFQTPGSHVLTVADVSNATITGSRPVTVGPPTPTGLAATATSTTQVNLTWNASAGATQYEILRGTTTLTSPVASFSDTVPAGASYVYKVRAVDASSRRSSYSAPDVATTIAFTDDPASTGVVVKTSHLTELRSAVNALRAAAGQGAVAFTDPSPAGVPIRAVHIQELRTAVAAARSAIGASTFVFTDPGLGTGTTVRALHVQDLRNAVK
jgi:hypothetical protein